MDIVFFVLGLFLLYVVLRGSNSAGKNMQRNGGVYLVGFLLALFISPYAIYCWVKDRS
jgi:hypothetical protein